MANEVATKETFSGSLMTALTENAMALPKDFNTTRFVQNAVALLNENTMLSDFAKQYGTGQINQGLMKGAYLGLDAMNKEFYLIPYKNTLSFMVDYRGAEKLCRKYAQRPVKDIYAKLVREGDDFSELIVDGHPSINFKPKAFNNNPIIGAFAVCLFDDGGILYDTMSLDELENTRRSSKASNSPAWTKYTGEMYKKTVLHRLCKHIGLDFDNANQIEAFYEDSEINTDMKEQAQSDIENETSTEIFDVEATEVE